MTRPEFQPSPRAVPPTAVFRSAMAALTAFQAGLRRESACPGFAGKYGLGAWRWLVLPKGWPAAREG